MISEMTSPGEIYVIRVDDMMNGVPYADAFYTEHNWCLSMVRSRILFALTVMFWTRGGLIPIPKE